MSALTVVVVYPDLLGTYGDGGNGLVLTRRAQWRGVSAELVEATSDGPLPAADLYCLGGGEDSPQVRAAELLRADRAFARSVGAGAAVLAVCAGYQIVGTSFPAADGSPRPGVGLLDLETRKGTGRRAVGEVLANPLGPDGVALPVLTGFENHGGITTLGSGVRPLARVVTGVGNGDGRRTEGAVAGRVLGTYLHGPVLARNPALADLLLAWALRVPPGSLAPLDDAEESALRAERQAAVSGRRTPRAAARSWWGEASAARGRRSPPR